MAPAARHLRRRHQRERALVEAGVRQLEARAAVDDVARCQQIEVEWPRAPAWLARPAPAGRGLQFVTVVEKLAESVIVVDEQRRVEEGRLRNWTHR